MTEESVFEYLLVRLNMVRTDLGSSYINFASQP